MTLQELIAQLKKVRDEAAAGHFVAAARATIPFQEGIFDLLESFGIKGVGAKATEAEIEELKCVHAEIIAACDAPATKKWGDGTFLKLLLEALLKILLPILIGADGKPLPK